MAVPTDLGRGSRRPVAAAVAILCLALPASAARIPVGPHTQLRTVEFEFTDEQSFSDGALRKVIAQQPMGKHTKLRRTFDWLPFVSPVVSQPFVPLELQKDVARLREFYRRNGFSHTKVDYEVEVDPKDDLADVRLQIDEGPPYILESITIADSTGASPEAWLPADRHGKWRRFVGDLDRHHGRRAGDKEITDIETEVGGWFRNQGYPYARATSRTVRDDLYFKAALNVDVSTGPRARVEAIRVESTVPDGEQIVRTTVPLSVGDWYSAERLSDGQRALLGREIVRSASADVPPQPQDSTVEVLVRLQKAKTHLVTGELGYLSDGGLTTTGEWRHRSFTGGARTLSVNVVVQTGVLAIEEVPERLVRVSPSFSIPGVFHPRASLVLTPFGEYRDDIEDNSWGYGFTTNLIYYDNSWVRAASIGYTISAKEVIEYRTGSDELDFFDQIEAAVDIDKHTTLSSFTLAATLGQQDHPMTPRRVLLFRPSVQTTVPGAWNTAEFLRCDLSTSFGRPLGNDASMWARFAVGHMFAYGKTYASTGETAQADAYFKLRDDLFTSGGGGDVRGWDSRLLGPKFPDIESGSDSTEVIANRYLPIGGLSRMSASIELRFPFIFVGRGWGMHAFTDGGRVWSTDDRFLSTSDLYDQERFFWASGLGIDRHSPVGPIRLSFAYVLNPSPLDVLRPQEFLNELEANGLTNVQTHWNRRLHVHLAIGAAF